LALIAIIFVFTLTLAPPIKNYFTQRAQINSLKSQVASDRTALEKARAELSIWQDPNYIKSQARERLHFVMPGERQYIVTGTDITKSQPQTTQIAGQLPEGAPWYTKLIASVTESGL
jgi:cell division protein FtsB